MPKELRATTAICRPAPFPATQPRTSKSAEPQSGHRNTANWNATDDEILLAARAAGLNWQSTASKHFPNKTANACRKRHERLVERRTHEDWDVRRLDMLAITYMEHRKEIWGPLAAKVGERWSVVEAKCMEKGLKNLQSIARAARKTSGEDPHARGNEEHEGDSGIGCSDAEVEPADQFASLPPAMTSASFQAMHHLSGLQSSLHNAPFNILPRPPPLPLYQPPPSAMTRVPSGTGKTTMAGPSAGDVLGKGRREQTPENPGQRGVSIKSMLSHAPQSL